MSLRATIPQIHFRRPGLERWSWLVLAAVGGGASACLFLFDPAGASFYPPCPFRALTGLYCPGCGSLRALHRLLHGDVLAAVKLNPLMVLSLPFLMYSAGSRAVGVAQGRGLPSVFLPAKWIWALLVVIILYGVWRNTPWYPAWLLPL